ncbi:autotransporter outer membrane beta-barrel domain-containing protein [Bordetella pseudohinzii]|uniref:BrkA autotransporter n=2 Tax=Bordetella pseudohinzii TaxID=1331258 RepID=A0A0M9ID60_9BORD|nr:autotransporter outer membrane beta-barrel domain-containing protein [Bordetella pseudohinzii]CUI90526.1 BrkA autotransporter precursor [Bordetella pseudohinzii]
MSNIRSLSRPGQPIRRPMRRAKWRAAPLVVALAAAFALPAQAQPIVYGPGLVEQPIRVGGGSAIIEGGTTISPQPPYPEHHSGTGVQVYGGGEATLKANEGAIYINAHGHSADGLFVGEGKITVNGGGTYINVVTDDTDDNINARGIYTAGDAGRSEFEGTDVFVTTQGSNSDGLRSYGQQATVKLNNATLTTSGDRSRGVTSWGGAEITLDNTGITTTGLQSHGVWLTAGGADKDTHLTLNNGSITTSGFQANGVEAYPGTHFTANNTSVHTTGDAYAVNIAGATFDGSQVDIVAEDARALVVSGATSQVDLVDSSIHSTKNGTQTVWISAGDVTLSGTRITAGGSDSIPVWSTGGQTALNGSLLETTQDGSRALLVQGGAVTLGMHEGAGTLVHTTGARANAVGVLNGASFSADGATLHTEGASSHALFIYGGDEAAPNTVDLARTTMTSQQADGLRFYGGHGVVNLDASSVTGGQNAIWAAPDNAGPGNGTVNASGSLITGRVGAESGSTINVNLKDASRWNVTLDSTVDELSNANSLIDLQAAGDVASRPTDASAYRQLNVRGNYSGADGVVAVNTYLNTGGELSNQHTDRLLVAGDAIGTTQVQVNGISGSPGGLTSPDARHLSHEGISVVQVAGASTSNAFTLKGGYVHAPEQPYTYRLFSYGPGAELGAADPAQSLVGNADGYWDYRLQSAYVGPEGPVTPDPTRPDVRPQVVPQVASYLTAPIALQYATYADMDSLHRRLGEIRDDRAMGLDKGKGEVFFRAYGGDFDYQSNRGFRGYGYDASGDYGAVQLGGNLFKQASEDGVWRFGAAGSMGRLTYRPDAVDGASRTKTDIYRLSGYATYLSNEGWYVDGILSLGWFNGDVRTDARGKVMDLKGNSFAASIEAGYPFDIGYGMNLEPQIQLVAQHLRFDSKRDADGLDVDIGSQTQGMARLGARLTRPVDLASGRITPYAGIHVLHAFNGASSVDVGDATFRTGQYGDAMRYSVGVTGTVSEMLSLYGEVARMQALGGSGVDGWLFNGGLRYRF